jgi:ABC-type transporter Mla MlaB component
MNARAVSRVTIAGELTILTAAEHLRRLLSVLPDSGGLRIDLSEVTELDTAGLQVLLLAEREAVSQRLAFELHAPSVAAAEALSITSLSPGE